MPPASRETDPVPSNSSPMVDQGVPGARRAEKPVPSVAISATFTAEPLEETLAYWIAEMGLHHQIRFAPYNQVFMQLLDDSSLLARNRNGLNVVLVRFEDWSRFRQETDLADLERNVHQLASALRTAVEKASSLLFVCICPPSPKFVALPEHGEFVKRTEKALASALNGLSALNLVTPAEFDRLYPVHEPHDPHGDELGHVPYTPEFFAALGTLIARKLHAARKKPYKVIALDCDDTLWQGICGEDGPAGVRLDEGRKAVQEFMLRQRELGMLLCLTSKNNPEDVIDTFHAHPEMPLRLDHFIAVRLNWKPKSENLKSLADELNVGLDSFIVLDDSPAECAEVQAGCPEVLTLPLPASSSEFPAFLNHIWAFDRWASTEEDRKRSALYQQEMERHRFEKRAANLEEFLASLDLQVRIEAACADQLARVSQLTERTNQMNFTTIRRTESELQEMLRSGHECLVVDVSDRFGSYGLTGVIIFQTATRALTVDSFLLSCRALGRGVEHRMLTGLGEIAHERNLDEVVIPLIPTARNRPAQALLQAVGAVFEEAAPAGSLFRFPADHLAGISMTQTGNIPPAPDRRPPEATLSTIDAKELDYARITDKLRDPSRILEYIRGNRAIKAGSTLDAPRTEIERRLAELWAGLLGLRSVGVHENFFDLGGHSLMAVQMVSQVRQLFDVDLSLKVVYDRDFTVAELAKAIELRQIQTAGADQYATILEELEHLSDEEVRALLAEEDNRSSGGKS